jgi:uncharacterized protein (TIGR03089 family)
LRAGATPLDKSARIEADPEEVTTPGDLLTYQLAQDGSRPLLTYYDDATGERVELSVATTANWVAKTANYLVDEPGVDQGDLVTVRLPLHWQAAVVLLACWAVGAQVSFDTSGIVTFTTPDVPVDGDAVVLSLEPMGADFSRLVAAQPDVFVSLDAGGADLVEAAATDLPNAARVLTVLPYDGANALSYGLIAPLAVGGSVVMVAHPDTTQLAARAQTERVTHTLGVTIDGLPRLDPSRD